jgi:hypothetical protein
MERHLRGSLTLWFACCAVALSACGTEAPFDDALELATLEQHTNLGDLGQALGTPVASPHTCGRTNDFTPSCGYSSGNSDVSYNWTAPRTGRYTFSTQGSNFDTILEVRPYNDTTQSLGCNDDTNGQLTSSVSILLSAGQQVVIITDGYGNACGDAKVNIQAQYMHFGGMFGGGDWGHPNPYTGGLSCPEGYTPYQTLGWSGMDWDMYFCGRLAEPGTEPKADFGGAFGYSSNGAYPNPVTGSTSCPPGYQDAQALGAYGTDWPVHYCHRQHSPGVPERYQFGGMYGYHDGGFYANPLTGQASCPQGFTASQILGTTNLDYEVWFCYRDTQP